MANLEEGAGAVGFASGMAAVTGATLPFLRAGDTIVIVRSQLLSSLHYL